MAAQIGWHHPEDNSEQWDGFNDSGIEHFAGRPIWHLAREINQNALDAAQSEKCVNVSFRYCEIPTSELPNIEELRATLTACHKESKNESAKAKMFFEAALAALARKRLGVLEVIDSNTVGMAGPSTNGTPFYAFTKAKGQSRKPSDTAGGSFGIGKLAPYAVSRLRSIFVSTVYETRDGTPQQLTQGKTVLMSHYNAKKLRMGLGFWGVKNKCKPIEGISAEIPDWIARASTKAQLRKRIGTKIVIPGFDATKNWQEHLAVSVAENFFGAINEGKLRVDIDGKYVLDSESIQTFFKSVGMRESILQLKNEPEQFDNSRDYLLALQNNVEVIVEHSEMAELGKCELRILMGEGLKRKVCALRNGMFISDNLNRLKSFPDFKEFVAVVVCQSTKGNELLRAMEPPRHDDFEPDRLPDKEEQRKGALALSHLASWIREMLKRHAKDPVSDVTELEELRDFFADEGDGDSGKGAEEVNPYGEVLIRAKRVSAKGASTSDFREVDADGGGEGGDGDGSGDGGEHDGNGSGMGSGTGGKGKESRKPMSLANVRAIPMSNKARAISFTPACSGAILLQLLEAGADSDYRVPIVKADQGKIDKGRVALSVKAGSRVTLGVELQQDFTGAVKVVAHEI